MSRRVADRHRLGGLVGAHVGGRAVGGRHAVVARTLRIGGAARSPTPTDAAGRGGRAGPAVPPTARPQLASSGADVARRHRRLARLGRGGGRGRRLLRASCRSSRWPPARSSPGPALLLGLADIVVMSSERWRSCPDRRWSRRSPVSGSTWSRSAGRGPRRGERAVRDRVRRPRRRSGRAAGLPAGHADESRRGHRRPTRARPVPELRDVVPARKTRRTTSGT